MLFYHTLILWHCVLKGILHIRCKIKKKFRKIILQITYYTTTHRAVINSASKDAEDLFKDLNRSGKRVNRALPFQEFLISRIPEKVLK